MLWTFLFPNPKYSGEKSTLENNQTQNKENCRTGFIESVHEIMRSATSLRPLAPALAVLYAKCIGVIDFEGPEKYNNTYHKPLIKVSKPPFYLVSPQSEHSIKKRSKQPLMPKAVMGAMYREILQKRIETK